MTEKQRERIQLKIDKLKKALVYDKKMWGGQHRDGQGVRYLITAEYVKLKDYKSGLRYLNWFDKYFPDDIGYPIFLFEATLILFKCNKLKEAEEKLNRTFFSNTYLIDKFFERDPVQYDKRESVNWEFESLVDNFSYRKTELEFNDFAIWVDTILKSKPFFDRANEFIEIKRKLKTEPDGAARTQLANRLSKIQRM